MAGPCAASLSVTRLPPRPDSYRHSFRCKARGPARLFGPAGQPRTCAGRRVRSSSVKVRAQLSQLGVGAIERAFLSVFGHMKGHVCQRGRRSGQTQAMVYRMGISMEPVCLHGRIGMFLSEDGYILSRVRRGPTSLCPHGPGEPSGALGRPRGGPPWPPGGWTDPRARGRILPARARG